MTQRETSAAGMTDNTRYLLIAALVVAAFFGAYRFAQASSARAAGSAGLVGAATAGAPAGGGAAAFGGGGCCGGGGAPVTGAAIVKGGVQTIDVDASSGFNPNVIELKAGIPTEITFSQASGCTGSVYSSDLGFQEDLSSGPKTVKIKALQPGTYNFACGMNMVTGQIVVK